MNNVTYSELLVPACDGRLPIGAVYKRHYETFKHRAAGVE